MISWMESDLLSSKIISEKSRLKKMYGSTNNAHLNRFDNVKIKVLELQTTKGGVYVFSVTLLGYLFVSCGTPWMCSDICSLNQDEIESFRAFVGTFAQISAGLAGILLAIIVFSVQLHAQREDEGAFFTRYLIKKHCIPWIMGYSLGFAAANCLAIFLNHFDLVVWQAGAMVFLLLGLIVLFAIILWLVNQSIQDSTESTFDLGFHLFRRDLAAVVAHESYTAELQQLFRRELDDNDIQYVPWEIIQSPSLRFHSDNVWKKTFTHPKAGKGIVDDINTACLYSLSSILRRYVNDFEALMTQMPGRTIDSHPTLVLTAKQYEAFGDNNRSNAMSADGSTIALSSPDTTNGLQTVLTEETERDVHNLLSRVFIVSPSCEDNLSSELTDFFERLRNKLKLHARNGDSVSLGMLLDKYIEILRITATEHHNIATIRGNVTFFDCLSNPLQRTFFELIRLCIISRDREAVNTLLTVTKHIYFIGVREQAVSISRWALELQAYLYNMATNDSKL